MRVGRAARRLLGPGGRPRLPHVLGRLARALREQETHGVPHIHFNGAGGNVTAGKYNDGSPSNRMILAHRLAVFGRPQRQTRGTALQRESSSSRFPLHQPNASLGAMRMPLHHALSSGPVLDTSGKRIEDESKKEPRPPEVQQGKPDVKPH